MEHGQLSMRTCEVELNPTPRPTRVLTTHPRHVNQALEAEPLSAREDGGKASPRSSTSSSASSASHYLRIVAREPPAAEPRSRIRSLVLQLAPERATYSAGSLYSPPLYSRGALNTLHNTAFPP